MSAEAADMPVKPRMPATIDTRKKISAHFRIVIAHSSRTRPRSAAARSKIGDLTSGLGTGSPIRHQAASDWRRPVIMTLLNRVPNGNIRPDNPAGTRMTVISHSASAQSRAAPKASTRNAALDRARTFITLLVLVHHSVIAYTYYGHTDPQSFLGFDGVVLFTDSFFMSAMFFLSGLFVWPSLQRKGIGWFLRDRWWRLGLPFIVAALVLMPVAYYAVELRRQDISFAAFWWKTVTVGPWPSGPAWFVWVLLALDVLAAL